jgi:hypothetical protein
VIDHVRDVLRTDAAAVTPGRDRVSERARRPGDRHDTDL